MELKVKQKLKLGKKRWAVLLVVAVVLAGGVALLLRPKGINYSIKPTREGADYLFENKNEAFTASFLKRSGQSDALHEMESVALNNRNLPWIRFSLAGKEKSKALDEIESLALNKKPGLGESPALEMALTLGNGPLARIKGEAFYKIKGLPFNRDVLVLKNILPHTDLTYQIIDKGVKEEIVVKSPEAFGIKRTVLSNLKGQSFQEKGIDNPVYKFTLKLDRAIPLDSLGITPGVKRPGDKGLAFYDGIKGEALNSLESSTDGIYEPARPVESDQVFNGVFVDAETGEYAFHFLKPVMYDAKGAKSEDIALLIRRIDSNEATSLASNQVAAGEIHKQSSNGNDVEKQQPTDIDVRKSRINHDSSTSLANLLPILAQSKNNINPPKATKNDPVVNSASLAKNLITKDPRIILDKSNHQSASFLSSYLERFSSFGTAIPSTLANLFPRINRLLANGSELTQMSEEVNRATLESERGIVPKSFAQEQPGDKSDALNISKSVAFNGEYVVLLIPSIEWLTDPAREYPIRIDPSVVHDTTAEFATGTLNRIKDDGSASSPQLKTAYLELPADEHTVGLWHMNNNWNDSSGNSNNGTAYGNATFTTSARLGSHAGTFDGTGDYVAISTNLNGTNTTQYTVEAWINPSSLVNGRNIYSERASGNAVKINFGIDSSGQLVWDARDDGGTDVAVTGSTTLTTSTWYHVVAWRDGNTLKIFLNGKEDGTTTGSLSSISNADRARIGTQSHFETQAPFNGQIDEVAIYNRALTPEEIAAHASRRPYGVYTSPVIDSGDTNTDWKYISWDERGVATGDGETPLDSSGLVAHWKFNETSGTTADNAEGTAALDGTLTGFSDTSGQDAAAGSGWTANNGLWPRSSPAALMFDGSDDYVVVGDNDLLSFTDGAGTDTAVTFSAWVYMHDDDSFRILGKYATSNYEYQFGTGGADKLQVYFFNSTASAYINAVADNEFATEAGLNEWHHVAATYNGSESETDLKLYIDGMQISTTNSETGTYNGMTNGTQNVYIGSLAGSTYFTDGLIDSVRIYNRALTADEILANYNATNIEFQTRSGATSTADDGTWNAWTPTTSESQLLSEDSPLSKDLISYWTLDEASGTRYDSWGTNDLTDNATVTSNPGKINTAGQFTAANSEHLSITDNASLSTGDIDFTVAGWMYLDSLTDYSTLVGKDRQSDNNVEYLVMYNQPGDRLAFSVSSDGTNGARTTVNADSVGSPSTGTWYFIVAWHDSVNNTLNIQVNNGTVDSTAYSAGVYDGSAAFGIGARPAGSGPLYTDGRIDHVGFWKRTLTSAERTALYNSGAPQHNPDGTDLTNDSQVGGIRSTSDTTTKIEGTGAEKITFGAPQVDGNTVALWHFDETNGDLGGTSGCDSGSTDVCDATSNNNNGEFNGSGIATGVVDGIFGKARSFNGSDDYVQVTENAGFRSSSLTIEAWVKPATAISSGSTEKTVIGHSAAVGAGRYGYLFTFSGNAGGNDGTLQLLLGKGDVGDWNVYKTTKSSWNANQWYHIAVTHDGSNFQFYIDGVAENSGAAAAFDYTQTPAALTINSSGSLRFDGTIDEVRISNVARSAEEIAEAYRAGRDHRLSRTITSTDLSSKTKVPFYVAADRPGTYLEATIGESAYANYEPDSNTVGLWHLEEETGTANTYIRDSSSTGADSTTIAGTTFVQGKIGKGRNFDGTDDYVSVSHSSSLEPSNLTVEAWAYPESLPGVGIQEIVNKNGGSCGYELFFGESDYLKFVVYNSGWQYLTYGPLTSSDLNKWYHMVGTLDSSGRKFYIDGELVASDSVTSYTACGTQELRLGDSQYWNPRYFNGTIDEVRISNVARSAAEIRQAYEVGRRTHPITIDFVSSPSSSYTASSSTISIANVSDVSPANLLFPGDTMIIRETTADTENIEQDTVTAVSGNTVTLQNGFSNNYTTNATVTKWQREYFELPRQARDAALDAVTRITLRVTNAAQGATFWLDDFRSGGSYMTDPGTVSRSTVSSANARYFQYRAIMSRQSDALNISKSVALSPTLQNVTLDYDNGYSYWKFDEGYGDTTYDSGLNSNHGTRGSGVAANKPAWTEEGRCVSGKCLEFDGTDDYVDMGDPSDGSLDYGSSTDFTISAWIKSGGDAEIQNIVDKRVAGATSKGYGLGVNTNGTVFAFISDDTNSATATSTGTVNDNNWYHAAVVFDRDGNAQLYINGIADGSASISSVGDVSNSGNYIIGDGNVNLGASSWREFNGFIDEVKIYPTARTPSEIKQDYLAGQAAAGSSMGSAATLGASTQDYLSDGLVGYWKLDEPSANTCTGSVNDSCDSSGNGNDGAWGGDTTVTAGKFGNGVTFDGTGDYVSVASPSFDLGSASFTYSTWFYHDGDSGDIDYLIDTRSGSNSGFAVILDWRVGQKDIDWGIVDADSTSWDPSPPPVTGYDGEWRHIVMIRNGNSMSLYMNGELLDSYTASGVDDIGQNSIYMGSRNNTVDFLDGTIDSVRIYNRALSPKEVRDLYNFAPGPVLHLKMDEKVSGDAQTLRDTSTYGNDGTTEQGANGTGMDCAKPGKYGGACEFDGTDDYVDAGSNSSLDDIAVKTISLWAYKKSDGIAPRLVQKANGNIDGWSVYWHGTTDDIFFAQDYGGTHARWSTDETLSLNTWYHIAVTYDNTSTSNDPTIYLDGRQVAITEEGTPIGSADSDASYNLNIGARYNGGTYDRILDGQIDDVRIYNYARTQAQIVEDMAGGVPGTAGAERTLTKYGRGSVIGPVAYWDFDEQKGQTAYDRSVNANNGTLGATSAASTDDPTWKTSVDCKLNGCLSFDGSADYVDIGDPADGSLDFAGTVSHSASFWMNAADNSSDANNRAVLDKNTGSWQGWDISVRANSNNVAYIRNNTIITTTSFSPNTWQHFVYTYDGSNVRVYRDGVLVTGPTATSVSLADNSSPLIIGRFSPISSGYFNGSIDEVKIYNFALTEDEVRREYNLGRAMTLGYETGSDAETGLESSLAGNPPVAEWRMDEGANDSCTGSTNDVCDTSGNTNDGAITGATWKKAGECKYGNCLSFNGSSDYVGVPSPTGIPTGSTARTISHWIKTSNDFSGMAVNYGTLLNGQQIYTGIYATSACTSGTTKTAIVGTGGGGSNVCGTTALNDGYWHFISATYDGSTWRLYVDGRQESSGTPTTNTVGSTLRLGLALDDTQGFNGLIDHVKIYDYARTPAQIAYDYNSGKPQWNLKLDESGGSTAYDSGPQDKDGILQGNAAFDTDTNNCQFNYCVDLDGTDDFISTAPFSPLAAAAQTTTNASWGGWHYLTSSAASKTLFEKATELRITTDASSQPLCEIYSSSAWQTPATPPSALSTSAWTHVFCTYDGSNVRTYVNGRLRDTEAETGSITAASSAAYVGSSSSGSGDVSGRADDIAIYNYALSANQVRQVYNRGSSVRFGN